MSTQILFLAVVTAVFVIGFLVGRGTCPHKHGDLSPEEIQRLRRIKNKLDSIDKKG